MAAATPQLDEIWNDLSIVLENIFRLDSLERADFISQDRFMSLYKFVEIIQTKFLIRFCFVILVLFNDILLVKNIALHFRLHHNQKRNQVIMKIKKLNYPVVDFTTE